MIDLGLNNMWNAWMLSFALGAIVLTALLATLCAFCESGFGPNTDGERKATPQQRTFASTHSTRLG